MKENKRMYCLLGVTAVLITVTGIMFKQQFLNILPLYVSLFVGLLQSRVNRLAFFIGGCNSILYAIVYVHFKLYATAAYALLFSTSMQFLTYFLWSRKPSGKATIFKSMKAWQRAAVAGGCIALYAVIWLILRSTDSGYRFFDITGSILGTLCSILTMLAFIEYVPLTIVSQLISVGLYISMMRENPAQVTWLIYILYSLTCQIFALRKVIALYAEQQKKKG